MYNEPKYDEDVVNLGYLNRKLEDTQENISKDVSDKTQGLSTHYTNTPQPPYKAGDTWIKDNKIYTCITTRDVGVFNQSDWVTESGATELAESKNKTYTSQPKNYHIGDTWILQSDTDHKAGKKGEILNAVQNSEEYNEDHWVKDIKYGLQSDINKIAEDLDEAINKVNADIEIVEGKITTTYYQNTIPEGKEGDLWYVTEAVDIYEKGKIYRFNGKLWKELDNPDVKKAIESANQAQLTADKKIQTFYSNTEPTENVGVGDLWINLADKNKLHRYNGTNWTPTYDTRIDELEETTTKTSQTVAEIQTDLGKVTTRVETVETTNQETQTLVAEQVVTNNQILSKVSETEVKLNNDYLTAEQVNAMNDTTIENIEILKKQQASSNLTAQGLQVQIDSIQNDGVSKVKNTTVDINEKGIEVGKSDSEFSSLFDNTGQYLKSYGRVIAEYTKDGSMADKLYAKTEATLIYIRNVKKIVDGEKAMYGYWIGGRVN